MSTELRCCEACELCVDRRTGIPSTKAGMGAGGRGCFRCLVLAPPAQAPGLGEPWGAALCPQTSAGTRVVYLSNTPVVGMKALVAEGYFRRLFSKLLRLPGSLGGSAASEGRPAAGRTRRRGQAGKGATGRPGQGLAGGVPGGTDSRTSSKPLRIQTPSDGPALP